MSRKSLLLVKAIVTACILGYLIVQIDLPSAGRAIRDSLGRWQILALMANMLLLVVSTLKWAALLRGVGVQASQCTLFRLYAIGYFASNFLPGVIGGDFVRWHMATRHIGEGSKIAATILVERATGLLALVLLCSVGVLLVPVLATGLVLTLLGGIALALIVAMIIATHRRLATCTVFRFRRGRIGAVVKPIYRIHRHFRTFGWRVLAVALAWSAVFYFSGGFVLYLICRSFYVPISPIQAGTEQLLISLLTMIPVSLGGLGLAQAGDVYLLGLLGLGAPVALGISVVRQVIAYLYVVFGGLLFVHWRSRQPGLSFYSDPRTGNAASESPRRITLTRSG